MRIYIMPLLIVLLVGLASAQDYQTHTQNKPFDLVVQPDSAIECNLTYIQYPDGTKTIFDLPMNKSITTFFIELNNYNYTQLGDICHGVVCTDGTTNEVGTICRTITPTGSNALVVQIIIIVLVYGVALVGFFGKNITISALGGIGMMVVGVFMASNGIGDIRGNTILFISYFTIGLGAIISLVAGVEFIGENL